VKYECAASYATWSRLDCIKAGEWNFTSADPTLTTFLQLQMLVFEDFSPYVRSNCDIVVGILNWNINGLKAVS
jgi:hypothetical protein